MTWNSRVRLLLASARYWGAGEHLQVPEPEEEDREERDGDAAEHGDPQREAGVLGAAIVGSLVHRA